ncbi:MAG: glutamate racemase, partial [Pseudoleptotrichia goodfellowii]|nr:glutamate racemase [Pseudoleptotrichia goodfellowii]
VRYYVTDGQEKFKEIGTMFLDENIDYVELIKL